MHTMGSNKHLIDAFVNGTYNSGIAYLSLAE